MERPDYAIQQDVETYFDRVMVPLLRKRFEQDGEVSPMAQVFCTRNERGFSFPNGQIGILSLVPTALLSVTQKDLFADLIADVVVRHRAIGVFVVAEAWWLETTEEEGRRIARTGESIADHPARKEGIVVTLEHIRFQATWRAPICPRRRGPRHARTVRPLSRSDPLGRPLHQAPAQGTLLMKRGVRVWTCDGCGKRETWRKGWFYLPGVESPGNRDPQGELLYPAAFCSDRCEDVGLARMLGD